jgi:hypothetical protein
MGWLAVAGGAMSIVLVAFIVESVASSPRTEAAPSATRATAPKPTSTPTEVVVTASASVAPPPAQSTTVYMDWSAGTVSSGPRSRASVFAQAEAMSIAGDSAGARALLEPRVFSTARASDEEVNLLRGICKAQHDRNCTAAIAAKYK